MTIFRLLLTPCLVLLCAHGQAQPTTTIKGTAPGFEYMEAGLAIWADPISRLPRVESSSTIDSEGNFELRIAHTDTLMGLLSLRRFAAPIYLTPGNTYHVEVTDENELPLVRTWQKGELKYSISKITDPRGETITNEDVNAVISEIDRAYFRFFADHAELIGTRVIPSRINAFEHDMTAPLPADSYTGLYVKYSAGEMRLACGLPRKAIYDSLLKDAPIMLHHSGWFAFFTLFYENYFENFSNRFGGKEVYNHLNEGLSFSGLDSLFLKDDFAQRSDLRHTIIIHGVSRSYFNNRYDRKALLHLLHEMELADGVDSERKAIAKRLKERLTKTGLGASYQTLGLDAGLEEGTPALLFISAPWSTHAAKEALALKRLVDKYGEYFNVIEIRIENSEKDTPKTAQPWPVTAPKNIAKFMDQMGVYRIPQFAWVDETGAITANNMSAPSDRLEKVLFKLKADAEKAKQIKIGQ